MIYIRNKNIYIGKSDKEGYGVFAKNKIKMNDIIQECPFIPLPSAQYKFPVSNIVFILDRAENIDEFPELKNKNSLVLGVGSMFNTSLDVKNRNCEWVVRPEMRCLEYFATKNIEAGEEILVYYGTGWIESRNMIKNLV